MQPKKAAYPSPTPPARYGTRSSGIPVGGEKDYIFLNTKGTCLLCYEPCDPSPSPEKKSVNLQTSINFCRLVSRYLGFSLEEVITSPLKAVGRNRQRLHGVGDEDEEGEGMRRVGKVALELCDKCAGLAHAFNQVHFQVQFHQMILDRCVRSVADIIQKADRRKVGDLFGEGEGEEGVKRLEKAFTRLSLGGYRSANRLRNKLYQKSLTKLSRSFPIIKLKRISKSGDWLPHVKKFENKNGLVPSPPKTASSRALAVSPLPKDANSKTVMLASFLGCIVSFWIVISLSFINLEEFVVNIKRERGIKVKVEREVVVEDDTSPKVDMAIIPSPEIVRRKSDTEKKVEVAPSPKKKRVYKRKSKQEKEEETTGQLQVKVAEEPKPKRRYVRKAKPIAVVAEEELKEPEPSPPSLTPQPPTTTPNPTPKNKPAKAKSRTSKTAGPASSKPKPDSVPPPPETSPISELSQFVNLQTSQKQVAPAQVDVPSTTAEFSSWQQPPAQYPPSQSDYSLNQLQSQSFLPAKATTVTQAAPIPIPSTQQYSYPAQTPYLSSQSNIQPFYPAVPSTSSYQQASTYYPSANPVPAQVSEQRRPSYGTTSIYNLDTGMGSGGTTYNYNYNSGSYNYSNNTSWPSNPPNVGLGDTNSTSSLPSQNPSYSFSQSVECTQPNSYGAYEAYPPQSVEASTTNVGIYAYDGYGNYVLQQETTYPYSSEPHSQSQSQLQASSSSSSTYFSSLLPPLPSTSAYVPPVEPKVDLDTASTSAAYTSSPATAVDEPAPSLTYEEPPTQLHDLEVEAEQLGEDEDSNGDAEPGTSTAKSQPKSLSIFPEVHWRQQSTEKKIPCAHSPTCTEQFTTSAQLQLHLRAHGTFPCNSCPKLFGKAHNLALHEKMNHSKSSKRCPRCPDYHLTSSTYKYLLHFLNKHLNISVHDEPCDVCNKPFVFGTKSINRRNHFRKYHDTHGKDPEGIRICKECKAPFLKEAQLKEHLDKGHCKVAEGNGAASVSIQISEAEQITFNTAVATAGQIMA